VLLAGLLRAGFAKAEAETTRDGGRVISVVQIRITDAGKRALAGWAVTPFDPQQRWPKRVILVFGFVGIAVFAFAAGWLVGTALKPWISG
jgi:hypothetical protein